MSEKNEWKLVPVEPTAEMWAAVNKLDDEMAAGAYDGKGASIEQIWACLVDAAPCPTCNDQGAVGNILNAQPCPDCTPAPSAPGDAQDERQADACPRCEGSGEITVMSDNSPDAHDVVVCCDHCQGSGAATDAAKYLAAALSGEKYRHMQIWAEYRNFHRSLCARFGYGHDAVHFRRDLVSLEEAIAAKVDAPAAGDALDAARYRALHWLAADADRLQAVMQACSSRDMAEYTSENLNALADAALAAQVPHKGDAA